MNFNAMIDGLGTFFIGILVVFVALVLLIIFIKVVGMVVGSIDGNNKQVAPAVKEVKEIKPVVQAPVVVAETTNNQDELELVAVITAAIAASLGTTTDKLQVRSLRKVERRVR